MTRIPLTPMAVADDQARREALDISRSFLIQAPAGSGKTELLSLRLLALLAEGVQRPEEIVAITFTRKAAGEMRHRLLETLAWAQDIVDGRLAAPKEAHDLNKLALARAALETDRREGWGLLANPAALRIQTIDSFCGSLTRQMPLLARLGQQPDTTDRANELFTEAARRTLLALEETSPDAEAVVTVLDHLGNQMGKLESLLAVMLAQRDQWLRHLAGAWDDPARSRKVLEDVLERVVEDQLRETAQRYGARLADLQEVARYAAANQLAMTQSGETLAEKDDVTALDGWNGKLKGTLKEQPIWSALRRLVLTDAGTPRKAMQARNGFPAQKTPGFLAGMKEELKAFTEDLEQDTTFCEQILIAADLPSTRYNETEWEVIHALFTLLRRALIELMLVFQETGQVDFGELQSRALVALGDEDSPTELAQQLDYQIRHLLVDEFQDTSQGQFELLRRLTRSWTPAESRTLFLVGDPMQSIYRFREADVGLFLKARMEGIGDIHPDFLRLEVNFRSQKKVVDWVNEAFQTIFPPADDMTLGAISYSASTAFRKAASTGGVQVHPLYDNDSDSEAAKVLELIAQARTENPSGSIAILVRAKSHVAATAQAMTEAGQPFRAIEMDPLSSRPAVQDLLSLTRALLQPADRVHWLALLRSPLCGLTLADLHGLMSERRHKGYTVPSLLAMEELTARLSDDGRYRAGRVARITSGLSRERGRLRVRQMVTKAWWQLGGDLLLRTEADRADVECCLQLIDDLDQGDHFDIDALEGEIARLFASPEPAGAGVVEIMTMHKSKGLEFDTVILPGLGRKPARDQEKLLNWEPVLLKSGVPGLLLAPMKHNEQESHALNSYLAGIRRQKEEHEARRILYVAATRARDTLHLVGQASISKEELKPASGSLLAHAWPAVETIYQEQMPDSVAAQDVEAALAWDELPVQPLRRLPLDILRAHDARSHTQKAGNDGFAVDAAAQNDLPRIRGIVLHRLFQLMGEDGLDHWPPQSLKARTPGIERLLQQEGLSKNTGEVAEGIVNTLASCLAHASFRWIFDPRHESASNEWLLLEKTDGGTVQHRLDRSFIDSSGVRWIVDYKTGEAGDADQYREQLGRYARLLGEIDARPVKAAIFDATSVVFTEIDLVVAG